jgi:signal transduction histidine kinase/ligand-binding sensor domain-containing protein
MANSANSQSPRSVYRLAQTFAALVTAVSLNALQPNVSLTQYGHTDWSRQDGRLPGAVSAVAQTRDGRLWVGTEFGLFRFDGVTFAPWKPPVGKQLPDQTIIALTAAPDGGLWIGTRKGLSYWKDEQLKHYLTTQGTNGPGVSSVIVDHAGTVWVGTAGFNSGGLCRVHADRIACFNPADGYGGRSVLTLFEDKAANVWIGSIGGVYRWNSTGFRPYRATPGVQAITQTSDGDVVVPSPDGLSRLVHERFVDDPAGKAIGSAHTRVLLSDRDGRLWIGTTGEGLLHLHQGRVDRFTHADGLSGDIVLSLFEDREGNMWVATDKGLDRFRDLPVTSLSRREGLSTDTVVSAFASRQGGVWLGTTEGLNRVWDGGIAVNSAGLSFRSIGSLFEERSGTLWIDSPQGLAFTQAGSVQWMTAPDGQQIGSIAAAAETRDGALWFSDLSHGLIRVEGHRAARVIPWSQFGNRLGSALDVDPTRGGLLIGFAQGGVALFEGDRATHWYTDRDGLGSGPVTDMHFDADGTAWIATEAGLSRLRNGRIATLALSNGLPCVQIHSMVEDDNRSLWLDTPCGLLRIARPDLAAWSADPKIRIVPTVFGIRDGMHPRARKSGYFRGAVKSQDGRLWFPELDGVAVVDPRHLPRNRLPPPVEIESIIVDQAGQTIHPGLKLPHISQGLQIEYTAFSFVDPDRVRFKYQLQGYDPGWIDAANRRQALYPSLPPGNYHFHVIAGNNDGVWNNVGAALDFSVAPSFYQTVWFRLLCGVVIGGIVWMAYILRMRTLEAKLDLRFAERMRERTRISRDLHDTLLQNISGFALQIDALSKIVTAPPSAGDQLRELRRQAEKWLRETRESLWDLRLEAADEDYLVTTIWQTGSQITEPKGIAFQVRASGHRRAVAIRTQRNLLRIVQEAVRNAAVHSNAREIDVHLSYLAEDQLRVEVCDNGQGFDFDAASRIPWHWGLATMRERAEEIGAQLQIDTSPGQGVRIEIRSPLVPPKAIDNDGQAFSHTHRR